MQLKKTLALFTVLSQIASVSLVYADPVATTSKETGQIPQANLVHGEINQASVNDLNNLQLLTSQDSIASSQKLPNGTIALQDTRTITVNGSIIKYYVPLPIYGAPATSALQHHPGFELNTDTSMLKVVSPGFPVYQPLNPLLNSQMKPAEEPLYWNAQMENMIVKVTAFHDELKATGRTAEAKQVAKILKAIKQTLKKSGIISDGRTAAVMTADYVLVQSSPMADGSWAQKTLYALKPVTVGGVKYAAGDMSRFGMTATQKKNPAEWLMAVESILADLAKLSAGSDNRTVAGAKQMIKKIQSASGTKDPKEGSYKDGTTSVQVSIRRIGEWDRILVTKTNGSTQQSTAYYLNAVSGTILIPEFPGYPFRPTVLTPKDAGYQAVYGVIQQEIKKAFPKKTSKATPELLKAIKKR